MGTWATKLYLNSIETDIIKYQTGVLPEYCMALIVFVLSINPLLFILSKLPGYKAGAPGKRKNSISHLFFRDHLKMLICSRHPRHLDLITTFAKDINTQFGSDNCAYIHIERGK